MMRRAMLLLTLSGVLGVLADMPVAAVRTLKEANSAYAATNYSQAAMLYEKALHLGAKAGGVYYNWGNALYRCGRLGRAIAAYQRAHQLLPRDSDIVANLATARAQTQDRIQLAEPPAVVRSFLFLYYSFSADELLWAIAFLLALLFTLLSIAAFVPRPALRTAAIAVMTLTCVIAVAALARLTAMHRQHHAVICADNVAAHAGAADSYAELFALNDGAEVTLLDRNADWLKISVNASRLDGADADASLVNKGWIRATDAVVY
jgi:tetratricopeptide (TPR) repeat protein